MSQINVYYLKQANVKLFKYKIPISKINLAKPTELLLLVGNL